MCGWQVKLHDPLVTHGPYLSALKIKGLYIKHYINSPVNLHDPLVTYGPYLSALKIKGLYIKHYINSPVNVTFTSQVQHDIL